MGLGELFGVGLGKLCGVGLGKLCGVGLGELFGVGLGELFGVGLFSGDFRFCDPLPMSKFTGSPLFSVDSSIR